MQSKNCLMRISLCSLSVLSIFLKADAESLNTDRGCQQVVVDVCDYQSEIDVFDVRINSLEGSTNQLQADVANHYSQLDVLNDCCKHAQSYSDFCDSRLRSVESCCEMMHSYTDGPKPPPYDGSFMDMCSCAIQSQVDMSDPRITMLESCCEQLHELTHMHCSYIDKLDHCCDDVHSQVDNHDGKLNTLASCCEILMPPDYHYESGGFSSVIFVDPLVYNEPGREYNTIQGALDFIGTPTTLKDQKQRYLILVSPGVYDEDLHIPVARIINIFAFGPVTLGDGSGQFFESSVPRNITWEIDRSKEFAGGPAPSLTISGAIQAKPCSMHNMYANGFDLSGVLSVVDYSPTGTYSAHELHLSGVKIRGELNTTADNGYLSAFLENCSCEQQVNAPNMCMMFVNHCMFNGPVTCEDYGAIRTSSFAQGMTVLTGPAPAAYAPTGFYDTVLTGTFSSPGSLLLDGATNYFFKFNGASLAGGATKVIQEDLTP